MKFVCRNNQFFTRSIQCPPVPAATLHGRYSLALAATGSNPSRTPRTRIPLTQQASALSSTLARRRVEQQVSLISCHWRCQSDKCGKSACTQSHVHLLMCCSCRKALSMPQICRGKRRMIGCCPCKLKQMQKLRQALRCEQNGASPRLHTEELCSYSNAAA